MTGAKIKITLDADSAQHMLDAMLRPAGNTKPLFAEIGSALERTTRERFTTHLSPDGIPWAPLKPATLKRKKGPGPLVERGDLLNSIHFLAGDGFVDLIAGPTEYAAIHQWGGAPGMSPGAAAIPARPYMGLSEDDQAEIREAVQGWLGGIVSAAI